MASCTKELEGSNLGDENIGWIEVYSDSEWLDRVELTQAIRETVDEQDRVVTAELESQFDEYKLILLSDLYALDNDYYGSTRIELHIIKDRDDTDDTTYSIVPTSNFSSSTTAICVGLKGYFNLQNNEPWSPTYLYEFEGDTSSGYTVRISKFDGDIYQISSYGGDYNFIYTGDILE